MMLIMQNIEHFYQSYLIHSKKKYPLGAHGLDFGCGTGPALADMLIKEGFKVSLYDPFFYPDKDVLSKQYDL